MKRLLFTLITFVLLFTACSPATPEPPRATAIPGPTDTAIPATDTATPGAPNSQWISYWDAYYGYGIAIPCWWVITPTGEHGGSMSLRSYDEAFFAAHSTKGEWTNGIAPDGAVKMDIAEFGVDANATTEDVVRQSSPAEDEIVSTQEVDLNGHPALLVEFKHITSDPPTYAKAYYLRFAPDKLLIVATYPSETFDSGDVQAIAHSLAFSKNESIAVPMTAPSEPLIDVPASCK